jgi:hypothetical protein
MTVDSLADRGELRQPPSQVQRMLKIPQREVSQNFAGRG